MTRTAALPQRRTARIDVAPLKKTDHAAYLDLLDLTTSGEGLPAEAAQILTLPPARPPFTHGPALCLTAHARRTPHPVGAVFASLPDWTLQHPLCQADPDLSDLLGDIALCVHGLAVAPSHRRHGIARALITEAETRARSTKYRLATLLHKPELAGFYQRLGYTTAHHVTIHLPDAAMGLTQPHSFMTAVKPLHPGVRVRTVPGAPGPVVTGLLPGCDLPPTARFHGGRLLP
ncbi:GNAT family N-acetyltransferase [Streptomyces sp. NBC_00557]|uniref:GNAT family N-acetyltransferase n=1 Tax=Streptomyces sp. NBC_00557 TaxID=2975776 RepID=UPI002E81BC7D|nr:GNAT family N-acetyltransferase [Streptomyces sp. NBC_00557]WUC39666.1 GNAT family N-acetyltransferase [Streptomyces sp. NBC_00557]